MTKSMKTILALFTASLISCFLFSSLSFGQEIPKPGEIIDKSNYKKYAHLIPEELYPGFENGWGGFWKPISLKIVPTKPASQPKRFLAFSEKNRGKYALDKDGFIIGGYDYEGLPFPGVRPDDKDFATKFMWNFTYRYMRDDWIGPMTAFSKRKGEPITFNISDEIIVEFVNRMYDDPKPNMKDPIGLQYAEWIRYSVPVNVRNFQMLIYRYLDPRKSDDTYLYLPTLRRVLRGEAGQRSTPIQGQNQALDDFQGFDGRIQDFTYKYIREQKLLGVADSKLNVGLVRKQTAQAGGVLFFDDDNWEVRDVYVIDIIPKNATYPQSRKRIYIDKENPTIYHAAVWDRAGNPWKFWSFEFAKRPCADGDTASSIEHNFGLDVQFGYGQTTTMDYKLNGHGFKYNDIMPSAMSKRGE
ncbi:MAG: DUF1329 domain-containing protein [Thermodesulfobacteriota bacterium]